VPGSAPELEMVPSALQAPRGARRGCAADSCFGRVRLRPGPGLGLGDDVAHAARACRFFRAVLCAQDLVAEGLILRGSRA